MFITVQQRENLEKCINVIRLFLNGDEKAMLYFYGAISVGKSTLINSLIGQELLPSSSDETTNTLTEMVARPGKEKPLIQEITSTSSNASHSEF